MATKKTTAAAEAAEAGVTVTPVTFSDSRYRARTLVLPGGRTLSVARGQVEVAADDAEALAFLERHPDLQRAAG